MNKPIDRTTLTDAQTPIIETLRARLTSFTARVKDEPKYNPVAQLAYHLSRDLESGSVSRDDLVQLAREIGAESLTARADALAAYVAPIDMAENRTRLKAAIGRLIDNAKTPDEMLAILKRRALGIIFTAHPTFLMSTPLRTAIAETASGRPVASWPQPIGPDARIALTDEHEAAMSALDAAKVAVAEFTRAAVEVLRERGVKDWRTVDIGYIGLGTWVGYDLDGRTDIRWTDSFRFRLMEKIRQIRRYETVIMAVAGSIEAEPEIEAGLEALAAKLGRARKATQAALSAFSAEKFGPKEISAAANALTENYPNKAVSIKPFVAELQGLIDRARERTAVDLIALRAEMQSLSFGVGEVHLRINSTQLHNSIRHQLSLETEDLGGRSMIEKLSQLMREEEPAKVNFGSLDIEAKTAMRQFILAAQILKHVDAGSTVRFLIAECETPATVLSALYLARFVGIDHALDVSPLFETPKALDSAARFFDVMFGLPEYQQAVRKRGRIAIQAGFSDAGRFMGQITAVLAIERLQGQLARACERHGLTDVEVLIFDTHGESVGRGAHPTSFQDRCYYVLSPWARRQFADRGLKLTHEVSFQGGDGYLYFTTPELALATITRQIEADADWRPLAEEDAFYTRTAFSFDFFRRLLAYHSQMLEDRNYHRALGAFAQGLLNDAGSRKLRRQFDVASGEVHQIRRIRAIPHNAMLQQLGYPLNVIAGFGGVVKGEEDRFKEVYFASDRLRRLTAAVLHVKRRSSIKMLSAFANLFDPAFWSSRPYAGSEGPEMAEPCLYIAQLLQKDDREIAINALAVSMRLDAIWLHNVFDAVGLNTDHAEQTDRERLAILQAIRLALLQHLFIMAARVPRFSTRNDVSREDIMEFIFSLRVPEAVAMLKETYPVNATDIGTYDLIEERTYPAERGASYVDIADNLIQPIDETYKTILSISATIALEFGAHG